MAMIPSLLIAMPSLQEILVDKAGNPLVNGVVTLTQDTDRLVLKNWYYETGSPGSYTFVQLDNPLTLSAAGTVVDPSGNDTIPFFYPYDETSTGNNPPVQKYYITVTDRDGNPQFDRQDFPYDLSTNQGGGGEVTVPTFENIVVNNEFWRNLGTVSGTPNALNGTILAPSQHDGFRMPDIEYIGSGASGTDTIAFTQFSAGGQTLTDDVTPEWYIDFTATASATSRIIQIPLSLHLLTLGGLKNCTITFQGQSSSANNMVSVGILADYGTNGATPAVVPVETFTLPTTWGKQVSIPFTFPNSSALVSATGDDAFYLQIILPTGATNLQIAKPSVYLSADVPTNNFTSYDVIDAVIDSPRTGDVKISLQGGIYQNGFRYFGYVPMNDGTIGNTGSHATARENIDTWPLFNLIWNTFFLFNVSTTNSLAQMYNSAGSPVAYGMSAYADWVANNAISLTKQMGRTLLGTVTTIQSCAAAPVQAEYIASSGTGAKLLITLNAPNPNLFLGMPIAFDNTGGALPTGLNTGIFYVSTITSTTQFYVATTYANALAATLITYTDAGSGINLVSMGMAGGFTGEYAHTQLEAQLATHSHTGSTQSTYQADSTTGGGHTTIGSGVGGAITGTTTLNIAADGSSTPFNVVQPATFMNFYIKL